MSLLSWDGFYIFGVAVKRLPKKTPQAVQQNVYPGVSGVESLAMGDRGTESVIAGRLSFDTELELRQGQAIFDSYNDGLPHVLVEVVQDGVGDTEPMTYENCLMHPVDWDKRYTYDDVNGYTIGYSVVIQHLTAS